MNSGAFLWIQKINLFTAWKRSQFFHLHPEFTKQLEICCAILADTHVSFVLLDTAALQYSCDTLQCWMLPRRWALPFQNRDFCKLYVLYLQRQIWVSAKTFSVFCSFTLFRLVSRLVAALNHLYVMRHRRSDKGADALHWNSRFTEISGTKIGQFENSCLFGNFTHSFKSDRLSLVFLFDCFIF